MSNRSMVEAVFNLELGNISFDSLYSRKYELTWEDPVTQGLEDPLIWRVELLTILDIQDDMDAGFTDFPQLR